MIDMFMGNLQGPYLDRMVGSTSSRFSDLALASEGIENMIKLGKIQNAASTSGITKKPYVVYGKKREAEANETDVLRVRAPMYRASYQQVADVLPKQNQQPYTVPIDQIVVQQPASYQQQQRYYP